MSTFVPLRRSRARIPGRRFLTVVPVAALVIALAADAASVALVKVSVPDNASDAARAGVSAIQFANQATPANAETAYEAAAQVAKTDGLDLDQQSFTIFADGSVRLTVHKHAPTLLFKRLPWFNHHTDTTSTVTVSRGAW